MVTTQQPKTYFIGDLVNLVNDLGGGNDSEKIWKEFIALLRKENVLDERFALNEEATSEVVKSGFKKAAVFLEEKLSISGLQICWHGMNRDKYTTHVELTEKKAQGTNSILVDKFEAPHFFLYLLPEIEDDEMMCDVISESAAKITASDDVLLEESKGRITITDLMTEAVFTVKDIIYSHYDYSF